jgi:Flp pilus assembly pilin Flp
MTHDTPRSGPRPSHGAAPSPWSDVSGATAVEYAIMIGAIAFVLFGTVALLGSRVKGLFADAVARWP